MDLWWVALDREVDQAATWSALSGDEVRRAKRLLVEAKRRQFVLARRATRKILGRALDRDPSELEFAVGEHGKPFLRDGPAFNVSHSGEVALVAVAHGVPLDLSSFPTCSLGRIGVDVEEVRESRPLDQIARRFFSSGEADRYLKLSKAKKTLDFYRRWALKEAYVKALGTGLTYSSRAFSHHDDQPSWEPRPLVEECQRFSNCREAWQFSNGWLTQDGRCYAVAVCADRLLPLRFFRY